MLTLKGLIIREEPRGESSKCIYALTAEYGVICIFVRGGMKSKKNSSPTQLYAYSTLCLDEKPGKGGDHRQFYLDSAEAENMFYDLRLNIKKMALAAYLCELLFYSRVQAFDKNEIMRLALNTFYFINNGKRDIEFLKSLFEFRLLCENGLRPDLLACKHCCAYESETMYFNLYSENIECENCCQNKEGLLTFAFDKTMLYIVRHIALTDFDRLFNLKISPGYQKQLTNFTEEFVKYHFKDKFDTLDFYRSI
ncbi:MAG: DNA repair protein RecO [Ruminococcus sp.]|nr:DNA repair protein RecO [Ruminococcus sp.]